MLPPFPPIIVCIYTAAIYVYDGSPTQKAGYTTQEQEQELQLIAICWTTCEPIQSCAKRDTQYTVACFAGGNRTLTCLHWNYH